MTPLILELDCETLQNQTNKMTQFEGVKLHNAFRCNYCYINVCINILLNHKVIRDLCLNEDYGILNLFKDFLSYPCKIHSAKKIRKFISNREPIYGTNEMQDAAEFLEYIISNGESTRLKDLFRFKLRTNFECVTCGNKSYTEEFWTSLKLYNLNGNSIEALVGNNLDKVSNIKKLCNKRTCPSSKKDGGEHFRTESIVEGKLDINSKCLYSIFIVLEKVWNFQNYYVI